jgi:hypothetical protein
MIITGTLLPDASRPGETAERVAPTLGRRGAAMVSTLGVVGRRRLGPEFGGACVQFLSLMLIVAFVAVLALVIALAILASPIFAAAGFVVGFGAFLVWRGQRRAQREHRIRHDSTRVPSTEEASADTVEDSGVAQVRPRTGS